MSNVKKIAPIGVVSAFILVLGSLPASAGILYPDPSQNMNLDDGTYVFLGAHAQGVDFLDTLQFSLIDGGDISATVNNKLIEPPSGAGSDATLISNEFLSITLFDNEGNFISAAGDGGILNATHLGAGMTYTLAISGKASGIFGGVYDGNLVVDDPIAAPLPAALPGFLSAIVALGMCCIRDRKLKV